MFGGMPYHRMTVPAHERIGCALILDGGGHRDGAVPALFTHALESCLKRLVLGLDRLCELEIRLRVLMPAVDVGIRGQIPQSGEIALHRFRRALEHAPAAAGEKRIAGKQHAVAQIGDMVKGVSGHCEHFQRNAKTIRRNPVTRPERMRQVWDVAVRRSVDREVIRQQPLNTGHVITVMMSDQNGSQVQVMALECLRDRCGVAGIDDDRPRGLRLMDEPSIIIAEDGDWCNFEHRSMLPRPTGRLNCQCLFNRTEESSMRALHEWFATPAGEDLAERETRLLTRRLAGLYARRVLQVGAYGGGRSPAVFGNVRQWVMDDCPDGSIDLEADSRVIPLTSSSVDVVMLIHQLEFSRAPHQVIREAARVLAPEGHLLVLGFNPYSLWGVRRALSGNAQTPPWSGRYLAARRIADWMMLLGMVPRRPEGVAVLPPPLSRWWLQRHPHSQANRRRESLGAGLNWIGGASLVIGQKRVNGAVNPPQQWRRRFEIIPGGLTQAGAGATRSRRGSWHDAG